MNEIWLWAVEFEDSRGGTQGSGLGSVMVHGHVPAT